MLLKHYQVLSEGRYIQYNMYCHFEVMNQVVNTARGHMVNYHLIVIVIEMNTNLFLTFYVQLLSMHFSNLTTKSYPCCPSGSHCSSILVEHQSRKNIRLFDYHALQIFEVDRILSCRLSCFFHGQSVLVVAVFNSMSI